MPREAFLMYVDDWLSSSRIESMDAHEERGYLRLLLRAWKQPDCALPTDDVTLASWSKMGTQWFRETADRTLRAAKVTSGQKVRACFVEKDGRLINERQRREWDYQQKILTARIANGKHGGRPKKEPAGNREDNLDETIRFREKKQNETNQVSSLLVSSEVKKLPYTKNGLTAEEFETAWERHKNYSRAYQESKDFVLQKIFSMNGSFDVAAFRVNHPLWCEYWERNPKGWNDFGSVTFLGWIQAGMPKPPAAKKTKQQQRDEGLMED